MNNKKGEHDHSQPAKKHKHSQPKSGSIEFYFHHPDHNTIVHCEGGPSNPYKTKHFGKKHVINKRYARGHGVNKNPTWFKFTKKLAKGYDLTSGITINVSEVPKSFKEE